MSNECNICKNNVLVTQKRIKCIKCQYQFHLECALSSSNTTISRVQWTCPACNINANRKVSNNSNTINKKVLDLDSISPNCPTPAIVNDSPTLSGEVNLLAAIRKEVEETIYKSLGVELKKIREELNGIQDIKDSLNYFSNLYDSVKQELEEAKREIATLNKNNSELREIINAHANTISILEKESRSSNLELHCIPEHRSENLVKTVEQIGRTVGFTLNEGNINKCTRISKQNKNSPRPRSVLVKFSNQLLRDKFMASVINFNKTNPDNKLNTSHLGISGEKSPVFISENLTTTAKDIYAATRIFAKEKQYRFVWSRNNNIFLRKSTATDAILIKSKDFLKTLN